MELKLQHRNRATSSQDLQSPDLQRIVEAPTFIELFLDNNDKPIMSNGTISSVHIPAHNLPNRCSELLTTPKNKARSSGSTTLPHTEDLNKNEINDLLYKNERKARKRLLNAALTFFAILALLIGAMTIMALTMFSKEVITPTPTPRPAISETPTQPHAPAPQTKTPTPNKTYNPAPSPKDNSNLKNNSNQNENTEPPSPSDGTVPNQNKTTDSSKDSTTPSEDKPKPEQPSTPDNGYKPNQNKPQ